MNFKNEILKIVQNKPERYLDIDEEYKNDYDIALTAIRGNYTLLKHFPEEFKSDKRIIFESIKYDVNNIQYRSDSIKNDKDFILKLAGAGINFEYLPLEYRLDKEMMKEAIDGYEFNIEYCDDSIKDIDLCYLSVEKDISCFLYFPEHIKNDKKVLFELLNFDENIFDFFDDNLKNEYGKDINTFLKNISENNKEEMGDYIEEVEESDFDGEIIFDLENQVKEEDIDNPLFSEDELKELYPQKPKSRSLVQDNPYISNENYSSNNTKIQNDSKKISFDFGR